MDGWVNVVLHHKASCIGLIVDTGVHNSLKSNEKQRNLPLRLFSANLE